MPKAEPRRKVVSECKVIERDDGRWVLFVNGHPRMVLPTRLGRTRPADRRVSHCSAD